jgi:hypothetical protein
MDALIFSRISLLCAAVLCVVQNQSVPVLMWKGNLLFNLREKDRTDGRQEFIIDKIQSTRHCVVANNLSVQSSQHDSSVALISQVLRAIGVNGHLRYEKNSRFTLHNLNILLHGGRKDLLNGSFVFCAADKSNFVLLDLNQSLDNQLLKKLGVVLTTGNNSALATGFRHQSVQELVTDLHLLHTAFSNFGRTGNTLLDLAVLFLLGEFVLDIQLGLVDKSLFLKVEVVFGLL